MSVNATERCDGDGLLVGPSDIVDDVAWHRGQPPRGCGRLVCGRCGRGVLSFAGCLLAHRPEAGLWLAIHDASDWSQWLVSDSGTSAWRTWVCGCRAFPASRPVAMEELAIDDDLPWACAGHSARPANRRRVDLAGDLP